jgi:hypothetical protein
MRAASWGEEARHATSALAARLVALGHAAEAAPLFARDLNETIEGSVGRVFRSPWLRTAGAALLMLLLPLQSLTDEAIKPGYGFRWDFYPVRACDWIEQHGVRGNGFHAFDQGGSLLWRFWPDRDRLPFMDIHQSGTRQDRYTVAYVPQDSVAWRTLDQQRRFDWVIWPRKKDTTPRLPDFLDADTTTWALVLSDDASALWLRRDGAMGALAERERYRWLPAGTLRLAEVGRAAYSNPVAREEIRAELDHALAASPWNANTHSLLANLELSAGNWNAALAHLAAARRAIPWLDGLDERERIARDSLAAEAARR